MKLIFAGTPENAASALEKISKHHEVVLVITREDAAIGRKKVLTPSKVAQKAEALGLPVLKRNKLKMDDLGQIAKSGAEKAVVVAYGALIPQAFLDLLPWWNLHFSLLPLWRGASPLQQSMIHGGKGAGITVFELDAGLDTGPIIAGQPVQIDFTKTFGELLDEFTELGANLVLSSLDAEVEPTKQAGTPTSAPKITRADARLNLEALADQVAWKIMGLNPEPGAWCMAGESPIKILRALSLGETNWDAIDQTANHPGRVFKSGEKVLLSCGSGTRVELVEIQPAGKNPMAAGDWYRGQTGSVHFE